jgi:hypothetical protein
MQERAGGHLSCLGHHISERGNTTLGATVGDTGGNVNVD